MHVCADTVTNTGFVPVTHSLASLFLFRAVVKLKVWCDYSYQVSWWTVSPRKSKSASWAQRKQRKDERQWRDTTGSWHLRNVTLGNKSEDSALCFPSLTISNLNLSFIISVSLQKEAPGLSLPLGSYKYNAINFHYCLDAESWFEGKWNMAQCLRNAMFFWHFPDREKVNRLKG